MMKEASKMAYYVVTQVVTRSLVGFRLARSGYRCSVGAAATDMQAPRSIILEVEIEVALLALSFNHRKCARARGKEEKQKRGSFGVLLNCLSA